MSVVVALVVIYSQLLISFKFTKNGLRGLFGICGLHANHRVWQERGITSEALVGYRTSAVNSQEYQEWTCLVCLVCLVSVVWMQITVQLLLFSKEVKA